MKYFINLHHWNLDEGHNNVSIRVVQQMPNNSVVQGRFDDNSLISLVYLVWDPGADIKTNVEVNPHNVVG